MTSRLPLDPRPDVSPLGPLGYTALVVLVALLGWFGAGWAVAAGMSS